MNIASLIWEDDRFLRIEQMQTIYSITVLPKNAFQKFRKFGGVPSAETSLSTLIRFEAIITDTDVVESLGIILEKL